MMFKRQKDQSSQARASDELSQEFFEHGGLGALIKLGLNSENERRGKNRLILFGTAALTVSLVLNVIQYITRPEPKLVSETVDGRIRPLPTLDEPLYGHKEILGWAERCVGKLYNLSYVDWRTKLQNDSLCLSDKGRQNFVKSLEQIGVFKYLNEENQGTMYAVPRAAILRQARLSGDGYREWVVDVPYRIVMDGRQKGSLEVVMTQRIRRVGLGIREDGLWVDDYLVRPAGSVQ
ncbi:MULTISPECIES: DotI/IcmL family type IV secretion protein [Pseudomonas]|uniref:DotI/IcmL/TraM family protein n=2 Tax=Pseudomonas luteola TaxID=47886 RepID=A0ABS0MW70_PSELU|nr:MULTISPECIES: DotI/IcmL family type IV secretion protein [Pseudomonas]MBA1250183.1 hypothetical protein [Pseudomonas zeshuii]MBH3440934.1 DotI/IcmL/TraM family protein [Pseudomonas luteola]